MDSDRVARWRAVAQRHRGSRMRLTRPRWRRGPGWRAGLAAAAAAVACVGTVVARAQTAAADIEARIDALLARMTLEEKIGQLQQLDGEANGNARPEHAGLARKGRLGSTLNVRGAARVNALQKVAVEESRLKIPLIFAFDVIHGYRTVFPIPLGEAASWDLAAIEEAAAIAAAEARAAGVQWTFAPMVDIARDARWGRIAEGAGEDPWLGAAIARARVRGFQGTDASAPDRMAACAKHWVAYGAAEAGRDYAATDVPEHTLRTVYFPPFRAAVDAGVLTVMSAFNALNGVPASANPWTLTDVLRKEWGFDGLVVSDYNSIIELRNHGVAADEREAARLALKSGVDMEMVSRSYASHLAELVKSGEVGLDVLDEAVRRVLRLKMRVGLFERPYADEARERSTLLSAKHREAARRIAARSMVLLENEGDVLPFPTNLSRVAVIGALADDRESTLGNWIGDGRLEDTVTVLAGIRAALPDADVRYARGVPVDVAALMPGSAAAIEAEKKASAGITEAVAVAREAEAVVLVLGESGAMSGEAASRADIGLPGRQLELAAAILDLGKPTAVVLMTGRPLALQELSDRAPAILLAWLPGTEGGNAVADVLFGRVNPGGKLPVTFPRVTGQVPIYYSQLRTGRPPVEKEKYTSKYLDVPWTPLYPFGHGLSYTRFELRDLRLSANRIGRDGKVEVSVEVVNTGRRPGDEVVQIYVQDVVASVARPVRELRGFERISLEPGRSRRVTFTLGPDAFGFLDASMRWVVEPGTFHIWAGTSSTSGLQATLQVE